MTTANDTKIWPKTVEEEDRDYIISLKQDCSRMKAALEEIKQHARRSWQPEIMENRLDIIRSIVKCELRE